MAGFEPTGDIRERFNGYGLQLHPQKTRLIRFNRPCRRNGVAEPKPETFDFLGFTHYWGVSRRGNTVVKVKTSGKRFTRTLIVTPRNRMR